MKPLPFPDSAQLVSVRQMMKREGWRRSAFSVPDFRDYRTQATRSFEAFAAFTDASFTLTGNTGAERIPGETVSHDYFSTLGVVPALGRGFVAEEDAAPNRVHVVVLSDELWRSRFAGDPDILGRAIKLDDHDHTVVGVMPPGFRGLHNRARTWVPLAVGGASLWDNRGGRWIEVIARLRRGTTFDQARAELMTVSGRVAAENPAPNIEIAADIAPLREELFGKARRPLLVLFGAVGFVLAITCANVANLMLVRLAGRRREVAIRTSLGASRGALAHLFIVESLAICGFGGTMGLVLAWWLLGAIKRLAPMDLSDGLIAVGLHGTVLAFAFAASVVCALAIAALPALLAARSNLNSALKEGGRSGRDGASGARIRATLVVGEISLSLALVFASTLFVRSFVNLVTQAPGYRTEHLLLQRVSLPGARYDTAARVNFVRQMIARAAGLPDVVSVALASDTPLDGEASASFFTAEIDSPDPSANEGRAYLHAVTPAFFQTLGIHFLLGQPFADFYAADSERVAIVSETLARRFWPDGNALGGRIRIGRGDANPWTRIIGIVGETKYHDLAQPRTRDPDVYLPFDQRPESNLTIAVHTRREAGGLTSDLRELIRALDPNLPVASATMEDRIARSTAGQRLSAQLMGAFAIVALTLAVIGLYGVVSFSVGQRTREIGVRIALGARPANIARMVLCGAGRLVTAGLLVGAALAFVLTRVIEALLFDVNPRDPLTFGTVASTLALVALLAAWLPARRAAKVDPMEALRYE